MTLLKPLSAKVMPKSAMIGGYGQKLTQEQAINQQRYAVEASFFAKRRKDMRREECNPAS